MYEYQGLKRLLYNKKQECIDIILDDNRTTLDKEKAKSVLDFCREVIAMCQSRKKF